MLERDSRTCAVCNLLRMTEYVFILRILNVRHVIGTQCRSLHSVNSVNRFQKRCWWSSSRIPLTLRNQAVLRMRSAPGSSLWKDQKVKFRVLSKPPKCKNRILSQGAIINLWHQDSTPIYDILWHQSVSESALALRNSEVMLPTFSPTYHPLGHKFRSGHQFDLRYLQREGTLSSNGKKKNELSESQ